MSEEYAATGIGERTNHRVEWVDLDLEDRPAAVVRIRYEFREQLVQLGVLREAPDPLTRRERARGFSGSSVRSLRAGDRSGADPDLAPVSVERRPARTGGAAATVAAHALKNQDKASRRRVAASVAAFACKRRPLSCRWFPCWGRPLRPPASGEDVRAAGAVGAVVESRPGGDPQGATDDHPTAVHCDARGGGRPCGCAATRPVRGSRSPDDASTIPELYRRAVVIDGCSEAFDTNPGGFPVAPKALAAAAASGVTAIDFVGQAGAASRTRSGRSPRSERVAEANPERYLVVRRHADIQRAKASGALGLILGFQNHRDAGRGHVAARRVPRTRGAHHAAHLQRAQLIGDGCLEPANAGPVDLGATRWRA